MFIRLNTCVLTTLLFSTSTVYASNDGGGTSILDFLRQLYAHLVSGGSSGNSVPELDGSLGPIAIALLAGIMGIAIEIKRRRKSCL